MYTEEGALHEIGDAGGGKRVKDRAILILSQFSALVHGPCGDGASGLALCEKAGPSPVKVGTRLLITRRA